MSCRDSHRSTLFPDSASTCQLFGFETLEPRLLLSTTVVDWGGEYVTSKQSWGRSQIQVSGDFDGEADAIDQLTAFPFNDVTPITPTSNYAGPNATFYGAATGISYDDTGGSNSFSGYHSGIRNDSPDDGSIMYQPNNLADYTSIFFWQKADFQSGYDAQPLALDADDVLRIETDNNFEGGEGRFLLRNGSQFYVSQTTFNGGVTFLEGAALENEMWAVYSPSGNNILFDDASAVYNVSTSSLTDITAVGFMHDVNQRTSRIWTGFREFSVELGVSPYLSDQVPASVNISSGDTNVNSGVHAKQWFDSSAFEAADGTTYAEGVGFYFGDGFQPGLTVSYDVTQQPVDQRVLKFDAFVDANVGAAGNVDDALIRLRVLDGSNNLLFESNLSHGDGVMPILDDVYIDLTNESTVKFVFDTDQYIPVNVNHVGVVLGDAEFVSAMPDGPGQSVTNLRASAVPGDGSQIELSWRQTDYTSSVNILRSDNGGATWTVLTNVGGGEGPRSWTDSTTSSGTAYLYQLQPLNSDDIGAVMGPITGTTASATGDFTEATPLVRIDDGQASNAILHSFGQWRNLGAFETHDMVTYATGLGMLFDTGTGHPTTGLTFMVPPDTANQVLHFDAFIDANLGTPATASDRLIRLKITSDYTEDNQGTFFNAGTDASAGVRSVVHYEGLLSYGAGQYVTLEDIYVDLAGHETFTITIEEDLYDGTSHGSAAVVLGDVSFVAAAPGDLQAPSSLRASAVAGHDDQLVLYWADLSSNEDGFKVERSLDAVNWTEIATVSGDTYSYLDTGLTPGVQQYYRVRAYSASGDSSYTNVDWATPTDSLSLSDMKSLQYEVKRGSGFAYQRQFFRTTDFEESPNPRVGLYNDQWWDGSAFQADDGTVYADGVGFAMSNYPWVPVRATYYVPDDQDIFRFDAFVDPLQSSATFTLRVYGDYGLANEQTLWFEDVSLEGGILPLIEDVYLDVNGFETLTFEWARGSGLGYSSNVIGGVLGNAAFTDSYPPGPTPPVSVRAGSAPVQRIDVRWDDTSSDELGFELERAIIDDQTGKLVWTSLGTLAPDTELYVDEGLLADTTYYYRVRSFNVEGTSPWSSYAQATTNAFNTDIDILSATYIGGSGNDDAGGVEIQSDGTIVMVGKLSAADLPFTATTYNLLGGGDGAVIRLNSSGTQVLSVTYLPGSVKDVSVGSDDRIAVAVAGYGPVVLTSDGSAVHAASPTLDADSPQVDRVDLGSNNHLAVLYYPSNFIGWFDLFDDAGNERAMRVVGDQVLNDVAYSATHDLVYTTGTNVRQIGGGSTLPITVANVRAWDPADLTTHAWEIYDWPTGTAATNGPQPGTVADSHGERVTIGQDGMLYFAAESAGTASMFLYDTQTIDLQLTGAQKPVIDDYSQDFNSGSAHVTWVGRYDPATGAIDQGQWLQARLDSGKTNTLVPVGLDADVDGNVYLTGQTYYSLYNRDGRLVEGEPLAPYLGGEAYVAKLAADFSERPYWTPFTYGENGTDSSGYGIAVRNGLVVAAIDINTTDGEMVTTDNALAKTRNSGTEAHLVTIGGFNGAFDAASDLTGTQTNDAVIELDWTDNVSLKAFGQVQRSIDGGTWNTIDTLSTTADTYTDTTAHPHGSEVRYRVRSFRASDGTYSPFSNEFAITIQAFPPTVSQVDRPNDAARPDQLTVVTVAFDEAINTPALSDFELNLQGGGSVDLSSSQLTWNALTHSAELDLSGLGLSYGHYELKVLAANITDQSGNPLDGNDDGTAGDDYVSQPIYVNLPGDANSDGVVDVLDLSILATNYGGTGQWGQGDYNNDGDIDVLDLSILATNYGQSVSAAVNLSQTEAGTSDSASDASDYTALAAWNEQSNNSGSNDLLSLWEDASAKSVDELLV